MAEDPRVVPYALFAVQSSCFPFDLVECDWSNTDTGPYWYGSGIQLLEAFLEALMERQQLEDLAKLADHELDADKNPN